MSNASPWSALALTAWVLLSGCASGAHGRDLRADAPARYPSAPPHSWAADKQARSPRAELGPIQSSLVDTDYFQGLLVRAGVPPHALPREGRRLTPEQATGLLSWLLAAEVPLRDFGPWRMGGDDLQEARHFDRG